MTVPLIRRMLWFQPVRAAAAVVAIAASASLLLFLDGLKRGVLDAAASYTDESGADLWLAHQGTESLIRSSSFLPAALTRAVLADSLVERAGPVLRAFVRVKSRRTQLTLLGIGYDLASGLGAPPHVVEGGTDLGAREVILDRGAAHRLGVGVGDTVRVNGARVRVKGLSTGTNLLATQMVFGRLDKLVGVTGAASQVSFVLVRLRQRADSAAFAAAWEEREPDVAVFTRAAFTRNNLTEVYAGFDPIMRSLAGQGAFVAAAVIALILYGRVLERRTQFAVLLSLGGTPGYLARVIAGQALALGALGLAAGAGLTALLGTLIDRYVPEMLFAYAPAEMARSAGLVLLAAAIGALLPLAQLRRLEPAEVFRA